MKTTRSSAALAPGKLLEDPGQLLALGGADSWHNPRQGNHLVGLSYCIKGHKKNALGSKEFLQLVRLDLTPGLSQSIVE